jgi:ribosome-binding factor A
MKFLISQVILRELNDPRLGLITILGVEPTEDLKEAKVYVSVFGSPGDRSKAEHALAQAKGFIQNEVGKNLETRNTPVLRFVFDDSQDKLKRIEALIEKVHQESRETQNGKETIQEDEQAGPRRGEAGEEDSEEGGHSGGQG